MSEVKQKDFISWLIDGALSLVFGKPNTNIQSYQSTYNGNTSYQPPSNGPKPGGCGCGMKK